MPNFLHRSTLIFLRSVPSAELPESPANYIQDPDLSAVDGWPSKYWIITGDVVSLMSPAQRATVDAAELEAARDSVAAQLDQTEDVLRAFMLTVLDELNLHALKHNAVLDAIDAATNLANLKTAVAAIADYPQRTAAQLRNTVRAKLGS